VLGRVDDIVKVKGVLLAPTAVEEAVRAVPELSEEFEVVVRKDGDLDEILLKVELLPDAQGQKASVLSRLKNHLRVKTNLGYSVEFHPYGSLPRHGAKAGRFKDLRNRNHPTQ
jgi:phenylacetate-CoA ligase